MPWLVKEPSEERLLFVHVPRCGGTSMVKHFHVEKKCRAHMDVYHKLGMIYFFYRYRMLESANFPIFTWENLYAGTIILIAFIVWFTDPQWDIEGCEGDRFCPAPLSISFWVMGSFTFMLSTFVMNAPVMGRVDWVRQLSMWTVTRLLCGFGASEDYLHGVNLNGYLMHYTASKMISHEFVTRDDLLHSFAIVRNPYSRMVSIYGYNKRGDCESFKHFVKEWKKKVDHYRELNSTEEWDVYCHALPMYEFCFEETEQIVPYIIRQEDLKVLTKEGGSTTELYQTHYKDLPEKILKALRDMPHSNSRPTSKPWYDFYDQETFDLVYEMFAKDFSTFAYDVAIPQRPDLKPKVTEPLRSFRSSLKHQLVVQEAVLLASKMIEQEIEIAIDMSDTLSSEEIDKKESQSEDDSESNHDDSSRSTSTGTNLSRRPSDEVDANQVTEDENNQTQTDMTLV